MNAITNENSTVKKVSAIAINFKLSLERINADKWKVNEDYI